MSNSKIIITAGLIGVGIGMMLAREKGTDLQKSIFDSIDELGSDITEFKEKILKVTDKIKMKVSDVKGNVESKTEKVMDTADDYKTMRGHVKTIFS